MALTDPLPTHVDAATIYELRLRGEPPCSDQLTKAVEWIGDRSLVLVDALNGAADQGLDVGWAK